MKVKKGRRADKEDRRSQKRQMIGKRRETKKKQKRRTKKRKKLCSTSPPGGNQVDGLPPVPHTATVAIHNRLCRRKSVNFAQSFDCVFALVVGLAAFLWICSTSPPGGNQVDGLPTAFNEYLKKN